MILHKLNKKQNKLKFVIFGDYGTRKSSMACDFAKMTNEKGEAFKVLYIDYETESLSGFNADRLEADGVNMENFLLLEPSTMAELNSMLKKVEEKEPFYELDEDGEETDIEIKDGYGNTFFPDAIVVDSVSALVQDIKSVQREISKVRAKVRNSNNSEASSLQKYVSQENADLELSDWGKIKGMGERFASQLIRKLNCHVAIIVRAKAEKKNVSKGRITQSIDTGREVMDTWNFLKYDGNIVIHLIKKENENGVTTSVIGIVDSKDRTGTYSQGAIIDNPSVTLWQSVIEKNKTRAENKSFDKRLNDEQKVKKTFNVGMKKAENKEVSKEDLSITIKDYFMRLNAEQKKELATKLKENKISPKDFVQGECAIEDLQKGMKIMQGE